MSGEGLHNSDRRSDLVDKLRQTVREAEALSTSIESIPSSLVWDRPADHPSVAELLWLIHLADEFRFRPVVDTIIQGFEPRLQHVNANVLLSTDPAPENDLGEILDQLVESRTKLIGLLDRVSATHWESLALFIDGIETTCEGFVAGIVHHDREILKTIGHRLHASDLSRT